MLRTNWYNCFRKGFMCYRVCKKRLLVTFCSLLKDLNKPGLVGNSHSHIARAQHRSCFVLYLGVGLSTGQVYSKNKKATVWK